MQQQDLAFRGAQHSHSFQQPKTKGQRARGRRIVRGFGGCLAAHVAQPATATPSASVGRRRTARATT